MTESKTITMRLPQSLRQQAEARGEDLSSGLRDSLERYYALLARARRGLEGRFTVGERGLLLDAWNGMFPPEAALLAENNVVLLEAQDIPAEAFRKWSASREALLGELSTLTPLEQVALVDALERWWRASKFGFAPRVEDLLK